MNNNYHTIPAIGTPNVTPIGSPVVPHIVPWKKGIGKDTTIDKVVEAIVRKKLGLTNDFKPFVNVLQEEYIFTVEHLNLVTPQALSTLKIPLLIRVILTEFCKQEEPKHFISSEFLASNNFLKNSSNNNNRSYLPILSEHERFVVLEIWEAVVNSSATNSNGESLLSQFYQSTWNNWTRLSSGVRDLFEEKNFKEKAEHLMKIMNEIMKGAQDTLDFSDSLERISVPHCLLNIQNKGFEKLGKAIVEALESTLGSSTMTQEVKIIWHTLIIGVSKRMQENYTQIKDGIDTILLKKQGSHWKTVHARLTDKTLLIFKDYEMKRMIDKVSLIPPFEYGEELDREFDEPSEFVFFIKKGNNKNVFCAKSKKSYDNWMKNLHWRLKLLHNELHSDSVGSSSKKKVSFKRTKKEKYFSDAPRKTQSAQVKNIKNEIEFGLFNSLQRPVVIINEKGIIEHVNPAASKRTRYEQKELIGNNLKLLLPDFFKDYHDQYVQNYLTTGVKKIIGIGRLIQIKCKDGELLNCHLTVTEVMSNGQRLFIGTMVTTESETNMGLDSLPTHHPNFTAFDNFVPSIIIIDIIGSIIYANHSAFKLTGYTQKHLIGNNVILIMPPKEAQNHDNHLKVYLSTGEKKVIGKSRAVPLLRKDGVIEDVNLEVTEYFSGGQQYFIGAINKKENTLESLLSTQKTVLNSLHIPIIVITEEGIIKIFNAQASLTFGYKSKSIIGKNVSTLMTKDVAWKHNSFLYEFMMTKKPKIIGKGRIVQVKCHDGSIKTCHLTVSLKKSDDIYIFIGMFAVVYNTDYSDDEM